MKQEKKHKLQLFYEILSAIDDSMIHQQIAKPTHIQHICRLSYDKMMIHINQLEQKGMIHREKESMGSITLTYKGKMFLKQYKQLLNLVVS